MCQELCPFLFYSSPSLIGMGGALRRRFPKLKDTVRARWKWRSGAGLAQLERSNHLQRHQWEPAPPFSSCLQSFPTSGSFPVTWLFASGGPSIEALALASVLPVNIQGCFPLRSTGWLSFLSKGLSRVCSSTTV